MLTKDQKEAVVKKVGMAEGDTGSTQVQIALLSARIEQISTHLQRFPKDKHSYRGLITLLARRRVFTKYLNRKQK